MLTELQAFHRIIPTVYYIYQKAFIDWDLGYSSAVAMVLFVMVLVVTLIQFRVQADKEA